MQAQHQYSTGTYTVTVCVTDDDGAQGCATASTYTPVAAALCQSITFEVTPVAGSGASPGTAATSTGVTIVSGQVSFLGLFDPWKPPAPGTYIGTVYSKGKEFEMGDKLDVKWGYGTGGVLVDSSRASARDYPVVAVYGPLASCSAVNGGGRSTPVSLTGVAGSRTYDGAKKVWKMGLTLAEPFKAEKCYVIKITDRVTGITSELFPFKTKK